MTEGNTTTEQRSSRANLSNSAMDYVLAIEKRLPHGLYLRDTGAPRGERNYFYVSHADGSEVWGCYSLKTLLAWVKRNYGKA